MGGLVRVLAVGVVMAVGARLAMASPVPDIPPRVPAETLKNVAEPWRAYLIQARAAEQIKDPLQRCLAFPDLPGNRWPPGHAAAHCHHHHAHARLSLAEIAAFVDRGDLSGLEARLDASQRRHFDATESGEDIHDVFNYGLFDPSPEADRVTSKWLERAPESAYANLARGSYLHRSAWKARGARFSAYTPKASMRRMSELMEQAIPYVERALQLDPKLMPAYTALVEIGMADSRPELMERAFERGNAVDPACVEMANVRMRALSPRWGGSYEQMLAYAAELLPHVARKPQLAMHLAAPFADRADRLDAADDYGAEMRQVLSVALGSGSDEDTLRSAANLALNSTDVPRDRWQALAYLLQESRFRDNSAWGKRQVAWELVRDEPEWSLRYSLSALALEPDNAFGRYVAAAGYFNAGRLNEADREYAIAIEDPKQRKASLREVSLMWLQAATPTDRAPLAKASPYIDRLLREYPDDGRAWLLDLERRFQSGPVDIETIRAALRKVDRSDPWQAERAKVLDAELARIGANNR